jgi:hypothetical protein
MKSLNENAAIGNAIENAAIALPDRFYIEISGGKAPHL